MSGVCDSFIIYTDEVPKLRIRVPYGTLVAQVLLSMTIFQSVPGCCVVTASVCFDLAGKNGRRMAGRGLEIACSEWSDMIL